MSDLGEKYARIRLADILQVKTNILVDFDERRKHGMDFYTRGSIIMDYKRVYLKHLNDGIAFYKQFFTVVWIILMLLSAVWTLILTAPIHCRGSIGEQVL